MQLLAGLRSWRKPIRDFSIAFVVFCALFVAMSPSPHGETTIPLISLFQASSASALTSPELSAAFAESAHATLTPPEMAVISTMLAMVFSGVIAFNLALFRHLRRVHASSRRGAWRGG